VKKELSTTSESRPCDVCARTILKGERTENYIGPEGQRYLVCELCGPRAEQSGWIRESAHADLPAHHKRSEPRRSLLGRLRRREDEDEADAANGASPEEEEYVEAPAPEPEAEDRPVGEERRREARHVRAVPTNAEVKIERALEIFNSSEHQRTVAGLMRSLGVPHVSAMPEPEAPREVTIIVAWELSWYRFRIDLGDDLEQVLLQAKGDELGEIKGEERHWNAVLDEAGLLVASDGSAP
jgi:hypothetical protein